MYAMIGGVVLVGGYTATYLYCNGLKGTAFCKFPCEPIIGECKEKTVRVRVGEKI